MSRFGRKTKADLLAEMFDIHQGVLTDQCWSSFSVFFFFNILKHTNVKALCHE